MESPITKTDRFLTENGLEKIHFHGTSHAWGYRENEPVIAVISDVDGDTAFQQAMSLYWGSAEYIPKPWCLFIIVDMAPHHGQMLENLAKQYNIHKIPVENLPEATKKEIENLQSLLKQYIPKDTNNPATALAESIKNWKTEKPSHEQKYKVKIETGNLEAYKENGRLAPSRKTIPLTVQSGDARIDGILPRLVDAGDGLVFDTEHRNLPMVYKLWIGECSELLLRFEADKGNIVEAASFWAVYQSFTRTKKLAFIEQNTGDILFSRRGLDD